MERKNILICLSVLFCLIIFSDKADARVSGTLIESPGLLGGALITPLASMHNMLGDRFIVEAMPAYWTVETIDNSANLNYKTNGYGGALALKYEISPHWGISLLGSYGSSVESSSTWTLTYNAANLSDSFISGTYKLERSSTIALSLTYDYFSEPDGFRLPMFIGIPYSMAKASGTEKWVNNGIVTIDHEYTGSSGILGISPEFNIWKIRFMPALVILGGVPSNYKMKFQDGRVVSGPSEISPGIWSSLLTLKYLPLGVSYTFQFNTSGGPLANMKEGSGMSVHSLTFSKSW